MKLKKERGKKKKSLQEVAYSVGVSKAHIWDLEAGNAKNPTIELMGKLAKYYEVTVSYLIGEEEGSNNGEFKVMYRNFQGLTEKDRKAVKVLMGALKTEKTNED